MKVLVTGYTGLLGSDIYKEGNKQGLEMYGVNSEILDITKKDIVEKYFENFTPDIIIHCAAYTNSDNAEVERDLCWKINVEGTRNLVDIAKKNDIPFIYISTDYVFDGNSDSPYTEEDSPNPINYYGYTKYEGEKLISSLLNKWFIVRVSWLFGENGKDFVKTMLQLAKTRDEINVVSDQFGSPTYTVDLAHSIISLINSKEYGIYHISNEDVCSWAEFAKEIFSQKNIKVKVNEISSEEYPAKIKRPKNSIFNKAKLIENGFTSLPKWQYSLKKYLEKLGENS